MSDFQKAGRHIRRLISYIGDAYFRNKYYDKCGYCHRIYAYCHRKRRDYILIAEHHRTCPHCGKVQKRIYNYENDEE